MAREFQKPSSMEWMDDLAKDQLHPSESTQGRSCEVVDRLSMVELQSFYGHECEELLSVDHEWWYEDDVQKLKAAMAKKAMRARLPGLRM